eukprot:COSAG02_NODE_6776_length_3366_cov_20.909703_3_plen_220_part_00
MPGAARGRKACEIGLPQRRTSSEISQMLERVDMPADQASFVRCICVVDKRQESSEDACRPCDWSAVASASSRHVGRHETSKDGGGEKAHWSLKQRGSPPVDSRGSKHPPHIRRPHPLRPSSRRAGPRAVAAPSPAFSTPKVSQFSNFNLSGYLGSWVHTCMHLKTRSFLGRRRPGAWVCARARGGALRRRPARRAQRRARISRRGRVPVYVVGTASAIL